MSSRWCPVSLSNIDPYRRVSNGRCTRSIHPIMPQTLNTFYIGVLQQTSERVCRHVWGQRDARRRASHVSILLARDKNDVAEPAQPCESKKARVRLAARLHTAVQSHSRNTLQIVKAEGHLCALSVAEDPSGSLHPLPPFPIACLRSSQDMPSADASLYMKHLRRSGSSCMLICSSDEIFFSRCINQTPVKERKYS